MPVGKHWDCAGEDNDGVNLRSAPYFDLLCRVGERKIVSLITTRRATLEEGHIVYEPSATKS